MAIHASCLTGSDSVQSEFPITDPSESKDRELVQLLPIILIILPFSNLQLLANTSFACLLIGPRTVTITGDGLVPVGSKSQSTFPSESFLP